MDRRVMGVPELRVTGVGQGSILCQDVGKGRQGNLERLAQERRLVAKVGLITAAEMALGPGADGGSLEDHLACRRRVAVFGGGASDALQCRTLWAAISDRGGRGEESIRLGSVGSHPLVDVRVL